MVSYTAMANNAASKIAQYGLSAVLMRHGATSGPSFEQTRGAPSFTPVRILRTSKTVRDDEGRVRSDVIGCLMAVTGTYVPAPGDFVQMSDTIPVTEDGFVKNGVISSILEIAPGPTAVLYKLQVKF